MYQYSQLESRFEGTYYTATFRCSSSGRTVSVRIEGPEHMELLNALYQRQNAIPAYALTVFEQLHHILCAAVEAGGSPVCVLPLKSIADREGTSVRALQEEWQGNGLGEALGGLRLELRGEGDEAMISIDTEHRRTSLQKAADECLSFIDTIWTIQRIQADMVSPHVAALYESMDKSPQNMRIRALIGGVAHSAAAALSDADACFRPLLAQLSSTAAEERSFSTTGKGGEAPAADVLREAEAHLTAIKAIAMSSSRQEWEMGRADGSPVGLRNVGNTCYLNAVLQSLFHLPWFREWLFDTDFAAREEEANRVRHDDAASVDDKAHARKYLRNVEVAKALRNLFAFLARSSRRACVPTVLVRDIAGLLGANENRFGVGSGPAQRAASIEDFWQQQDAAEFQEWLVTNLETAAKGMHSMPRDGALPSQQPQQQEHQSTGPPGASNPSHGRVVSMQEALESREPLTELFTVRSVHLQRRHEMLPTPVPLARSASGGAVALEENSYFLRLSLGTRDAPLTPERIPADAVPRGFGSHDCGTPIPRAYGLYPPGRCHIYTSLNRMVGWEESDAEGFSHTRTELTSLPPVLTCALGRADMTGELIKHSFPLEERLYLDDYVASDVGEDWAETHPSQPRRVWTSQGRHAVRRAQKELALAEQRRDNAAQQLAIAEGRLHSVMAEDEGAENDAQLERNVMEATGAIDEAARELSAAEEALGCAKQRVVEAYETHSVARYVVRSVVVFRGQTPLAGHFYTYVRELSGSWLLLNDANVHCAVSPESVRAVCEGGESDGDRVFMLTYVREQDLERFHQLLDDHAQHVSAKEAAPAPPSNEALWGHPSLYPPLRVARVPVALEQQVAEEDRHAQTEVFNRLATVRDEVVRMQTIYIRCRNSTSLRVAYEVRLKLIRYLSQVPPRARTILQDQVKSDLRQKWERIETSEQGLEEEMTLQNAVCDSMFMGVELMEAGGSPEEVISVTEDMVRAAIESVRSGGATSTRGGDTSAGNAANAGAGDNSVGSDAPNAGAGDTSAGNAANTGAGDNSVGSNAANAGGGDTSVGSNASNAGAGDNSVANAGVEADSDKAPKLAPPDVPEDAFERMSIQGPEERCLVRILRKLPRDCKPRNHLVQLPGASAVYRITDEDWRLFARTMQMDLLGEPFPSRDAALKFDCEVFILSWIELEREKKGMGVDILTRGPLSRSEDDVDTYVWCLLPASASAALSHSSTIDARVVRPLSDEEFAAVQRWHRTRNHDWESRECPELHLPQGAVVQFLEDHFGIPGGPNAAFSLAEYGVWSVMERRLGVSVVGMPQQQRRQAPATYLSEEEMMRIAIEQSMREMTSHENGYRGGNATITELNEGDE